MVGSGMIEIQERMCNDQMIRDVFESVGRRHGFNAVAKVTSSRKFRIKVDQVGMNVVYRISDFLRGAPEPVLTDLAEHVTCRIKGVQRTLTDETARYLWTGMLNNRFQYIMRHHAIKLGTEGKCKDLQESYDRLIALGLVQRDDNLCLSWMNNASRSVCDVDIPFRIITMSDKFDKEWVPDSCLDLALYTALIDMTPRTWTDTEQEARERRNYMLDMFPEYIEISKQVVSIANGRKL